MYVCVREKESLWSVWREREVTFCPGLECVAGVSDQLQLGSVALELSTLSETWPEDKVREEEEGGGGG